MNQEELNEIVRLHGLWLRNEKGGVRADLSNADLRNVTLYGADLLRADLSYANLLGANLRDANLSDADLFGANLSGANLSGASLCDADMGDADLFNANLSDAVLHGANLREAELRNANLSGTDLSCADLSGVISGPAYYSISWSGHGEIGRRLHAVEQDGRLVFSCGCFIGCENDILEYIEEGDKLHAESRLKALEIILDLARMGGVGMSNKTFRRASGMDALVVVYVLLTFAQLALSMCTTAVSRPDTLHSVFVLSLWIIARRSDDKKSSLQLGGGVR